MFNHRDVSLLASVFALSACMSTPNEMSVQKSVFEGGASSPQAIDLNTLNKEVPKMEQYQSLESIQSDISAVASSQSYPQFSKQANLNFAAKNMPISEFVNYAFSSLLNTNYLYNKDESKQTNVTLNLNEKVSQQQVFDVVKQTLADRNIAIKYNDGLFYLFHLDKQAVKKDYAIGLGRDVSDIPAGGEKVYQIVPLKFVNGRDLQTILMDLTSANSRAYNRANAVILHGVPTEVARAMGIIRLLDVPAANGRHIAMRKLTYLSPEEFKKTVSEILTTEGFSGEGAGNTKLYNIALMDRLKAVIIHSSEKTIVERIKYWADKLDIPEAAAEKSYLSYFPQYTRATELSEAIGQLISAEASVKGINSNSSNLSGGTQFQSASQRNQARNSRASGSSNNSNQRSKQQEVSSTIVNDMAVVADDKRNALIFYTEPARYQALLPIIKQLDRPPLQVLLETRIVEVTLTEEFKHGVEWFVENGNYSLGTAGLGSNPAGIAWALSGANYNVAISMLETDNQVEILSSPRLVVRDGESANINVGSEIPIVVGQTNSIENPDNIQQQIQYRNTGVILNVTPNINAQGLVSLEVSQEVSEAGEDKIPGINSPIILNRSIKTFVSAKSGQTIVLGGLISENNSNNESKVPFLGDIPILGNLFVKGSDSKVRTELVILITPKVLYQEGDIAELKGLFNDEFEFLSVQ
ncbi:secretin N-terminal domain-containing protein [Pseudoalteromonas piratica]|uniref:NolW-like domain-containing protein n=1 Tax=Pseudoalteromonas piratica TaxID=1348114 RepID=A0A0A7ED68_9GAMM|nr:secretin N-terminal domain-containing protein [Pseudoalteromonas piratica]AIY64585.1 hypothetical protein OM33_05040 [Pseudoalteromonas piratica]